MANETITHVDLLWRRTGNVQLGQVAGHAYVKDFLFPVLRLVVGKDGEHIGCPTRLTKRLADDMYLRPPEKDVEIKVRITDDFVTNLNSGQEK